MRKIDHIIFDELNKMPIDSIAACCIGFERYELINNLRWFGYDVDVYDFHPQLDIDYNRVDVIMDDVKLNHDLIINFNVENTYPIGRVHKGRMLLVYDDKYHAGNCTTYTDNIVEQIAEDNRINIEYSLTIGTNKKNFYVVLGESC